MLCQLPCDAERLQVENAVVCFHPEDGRVLFAIPWGPQTYIGTTDTDFSADPAEVAATHEDVVYLLAASNHYFPEAKLTEADVLSTWAGVRPLIGQEDADDESAVSREHEIRVDPDFLITIAGGKLTTYRRMAGEVVDRAVSLLMLAGKLPPDLREARTDREALPGAIGWPRNDDKTKVVQSVVDAAQGKLPEDICRYLANIYGTRGADVAERAAKNQRLAARLVPGRPEILAQVDHSVETELAATVRDFFIRRTQIFFRDRDQGLTAVETVAARMRELLGWSEDAETREILAYQSEVARSRRWQDER